MMKRSFIRTAVATFAIGLGIASVQAQTFPSKPITVIVPFAAGGAADVLARVISQEASAALGQPIVIDNRGGAGGSIGAAAVAKAPADGHTLLFVAAGHAGMGALYPRLTFDPVKDFSPVIGLATAPIAIAVNAQSKYRTLADLVADARAHPGKLNCAGGGGGATVTNLAFELLKSELGLQITAVPYKGSAPAITGLIAGEIDCDSDAASSILPMVQGGKLRALAVTTAQRASALPDTPTVAETVRPGFAASVWYGLLAPAGTPRPVVDRLHREFQAAMDKPQVRERLKALAADPMNADPAAFGQFMASETTRWSGVIQKLGLKAD
ncbi:MAG: tripartite tricarboxylate transporter substrate binding protein [Burkholderiales bacterium]|jgi:tripartite-type tricarboxylate transporter receptor subunit TctC|nr:tripartite tricarboxylate transporter substrate binding protein [Burkholderiales bacterium]